jgi:thiol-disulfide isomerase/thioredoxin
MLFISVMCLSFVSLAQDLPSYASYLDTSLFRSITLVNSKGKAGLVSFKNPGVNVLVFLSPECPLCINYTRTLNELVTTFGSKATFTGIVPGKAYSAEEVEKFKKDYKVRFNIYIDRDKRLSKGCKATVTPEVIVFKQDGKVIYRGAIDDWAIAPGKKKQKAFNEYLHDAMQAYITGSVIKLKSTKPVGCLINDY